MSQLVKHFCIVTASLEFLACWVSIGPKTQYTDCDKGAVDCKRCQTALARWEASEDGGQADRELKACRFEAASLRKGAKLEAVKLCGTVAADPTLPQGLRDQAAKIAKLAAPVVKAVKPSKTAAPKAPAVVHWDGTGLADQTHKGCRHGKPGQTVPCTVGGPGAVTCGMCRKMITSRQAKIAEGSGVSASMARRKLAERNLDRQLSPKSGPELDARIAAVAAELAMLNSLRPTVSR